MLNEEDDDAMRRWKLMSKSMSHCDSYYVNATKFTYWSVHDGLTDTLIVNVIVFVVSLSFPRLPSPISIARSVITFRLGYSSPLVVKAWTCDSKGHRFECRPFHFQVTALCKLFTHMCLCHQAV